MNEGSGFQDSYAGGSAAGGNGAFVGGLVGVNKDNGGASTPTIQSSYSTTAVNAGSDAMVGGLIGQDLAQTGTTNAYWDLGHQRRLRSDQRSRKCPERSRHHRTDEH